MWKCVSHSKRKCICKCKLFFLSTALLSAASQLVFTLQLASATRSYYCNQTYTSRAQLTLIAVYWLWSFCSLLKGTRFWGCRCR